MTQVKMGIGNTIFSNLGPIRGQYVFFILYVFSTFNIFFFLVIQPHIIEIIMLSG